MNSMKNRKIIELLQGNDDLFSIYEADGFIFAFNELCDLTGFSVPSSRKVGNELAIDYQIGLAVVEDKFDRVNCFKQKILRREYVILPMILSFEVTRQTITEKHRMTKWLLNRIDQDMRRFSLPSGEAISMIDDGTDSFIEKLKRVYKTDFAETIAIPLRKLHEASGGDDIA